KAFDYYSKAVLYAPVNTESAELALAYGNRSAIYFEQYQWENCLLDIKLALDNGYAVYKRNRKLLIRKIECLIALNRFEEARSVLDELPEHDPNLDSFEDDRAQRLRLQLIDIDAGMPKEETQIDPLLPIIYNLCQTKKFIPTKDLLSLSCKLELCYNETKGRHLVARENIKPGEIVIVEFPASSVLLKQYEHSFCHHCNKSLQYTNEPLKFSSKVSCDLCTNVIFCSQMCKKLANTYHQYECSILPILHDIGIGHLSFRLLVTTRIDTIRQVVENYIKEGSNPLVFKDAVDLFSCYMQVYQLVDHSNKFTHEDLLQYTITAGLLARLAIHSGYIHNYDEELFVGGILLRHILQLVTNAHSISLFYNFNSNDDKFFQDNFKDVRIASAIYPTVSLLNHSCDPNVVATFVQGSLNIIRASKEILAGDEVFNCYGPHFVRFNNVERKRVLEDQYFFKCTCQRCEFEQRNGFEEYYPICCQKYDCKIKNFPLYRTKPNEDFFICPNCNCHSLETNVKKKINSIQSYLKRIDDILKQIEEFPNDSINKMIEIEGYLDILEEMLCRDQSYHLGHLFDRVSEHYWKMDKVGKSIFYLNKSISIIAANLGPNSIELSFELVKLCDLYYVLFTTTNYNKELNEKIQSTFEVTIKLLGNFSFLDNETCYFAKESKRLSSYLDRHKTSMLFYDY
ncbi:hypothetical protein BLOT_014071, partial [Blomia tropicalis]